jgi:seryl-tRNA synthetase
MAKEEQFRGGEESEIRQETPPANVENQDAKKVDNAFATKVFSYYEKRNGQTIANEFDITFSKDDEKRFVRESRESLKKKISNLLELVAEEKIEKQDLYAKVEPLNAEVKVLDKQIREVQVNLQKIEESQQMDRQIRNSCDVYYQKMDDNDFNLKRRIVRDWVREINITDEGGIKIKMRVPEIAGNILKNEDKSYNSLSLNMAK